MGSQRLTALLDHYGEARAAWEDSACWHKIPGLTGETARQLRLGKSEVDAERSYEVFLESGARLTHLYDEDYPELLKNIYDPPVLLYYIGELAQSHDICVAMIGSRRATAYGTQAAAMLAKEVAYQGIYVVAGMARGIDSVCHQAAMEAGGRTLAVLGSGVDVVYPRENEKLYRRIAENGAVISEFPLGTLPKPGHFPMRNRVISGLSHGVVVVEAGEKSGTLLTVEHALSQGRDVFAVPGPITSPGSVGTNRLLKQGCKPVLTGKDIWEEYITRGKASPGFAKNARDFALSEEEREVLQLLTMPVHFDRLAEELGMEPSKLASMLTLWEIRGIVKQLPGKYYLCDVVDF